MEEGGRVSKERQVLNEWVRNYVDPMFKVDWGKIKLSKANTREHNMRVCEICCTLIEHGIPFATEVRLNCGARPDIICPTHVQPIIEVLHSETKEDFGRLKANKYPPELQGCWILHYTSEEYNERVIF